MDNCGVCTEFKRKHLIRPGLFKNDRCINLKVNTSLHYMFFLFSSFIGKPKKSWKHFWKQWYEMSASQPIYQTHLWLCICPLNSDQNIFFKCTNNSNAAFNSTDTPLVIICFCKPADMKMFSHSQEGKLAKKHFLKYFSFLTVQTEQQKKNCPLSKENCKSSSWISMTEGQSCVTVMWNLKRHLHSASLIDQSGCVNESARSDHSTDHSECVQHVCLCVGSMLRLNVLHDPSSQSRRHQQSSSNTRPQTHTHTETASSKLALKAKLGFHGHPLSVTS